MTTPPVNPYPGSQYPEISPVLLAVFQDIQARNVSMAQFTPSMTKLPPDNPGEAYALSIFDRMAHMTIHRFSPGNGFVELYFGTGGHQFGPKTVDGLITVPSQAADLISLFTVTWITLQINRVCLAPFSMKKIKSFYPEVIANPAYRNFLRVFCYNVLGMAEDTFTSATNTVGYATDYDDQ